MQEVWKDIPNYEGLYQVSNIGRVKSLSRKVKHPSGGLRSINERILSSSVNRDGYLKITIIKLGSLKTFIIHQLVAMVFLGHEPCGMRLVVDHIDNNKLNNNVDNLQVITSRENTSKDRKGYSSKHIGVSWCKQSNKWLASIRMNGVSKYLGRFTSELDAAESYKEALELVNKLNHE